MGLFDALDLSPAQRLISEFIPSLVNAGLSKNAIFETVASYAPSITRVQSGSLVDYARSILRSTAEITSAEKQQILNSTNFPFATSPLTRNYNVKVSANVFNPETGEYEKNYVTIAVDSFTSKQAFLDQYGDLVTSYFIDYAQASKGGYVDIQSMEVRSVLRNPVLP